METRVSQSIPNDYSGESALALPNRISAVSWGAIFAGAAAAAALSLIMLVLGTGLGLSVVSPWAQKGVSATTWGVTTILWVTLTAVVASGIGGYIAGRLRSRWVAVHSDEVYFRDTAHGFLAWAVATLTTAALLTSVITGILGTAAETGAKVAQSAAVGTAVAASTAAVAANKTDEPKFDTEKSLSYFLDFLFRKNSTAAAVAPGATSPLTQGPTTVPNDPEADAAAKAEIARIFLNALAEGKLPPADLTYTGELLSQQVGISQQDAENRITATFNTVQTKLREAEVAARDAADKARKATAYGSLWLFISLLIGAFVASFTAIYGGRQRDL
ncbi:MAG: hypothetical protein EOO52_01235 [Gammaproteobacteria bacterium]|nr:MAG: hypothetical protein EOO52_01235 [Gammaproteobacteria bacterium]